MLVFVVNKGVNKLECELQSTREYTLLVRDNRGLKRSYCTCIGLFMFYHLSIYSLRGQVGKTYIINFDSGVE